MPRPGKNGVIVEVACEELLQELRRILKTKLQFTDDQVFETLADLLTFLNVVEITKTLKVVAADPADDIMLKCALVASATHIITGDAKRLLPLKICQGVAIVTPMELLASLPQP